MDSKIEILSPSALLGSTVYEVVASGTVSIFNGETVSFNLSEESLSFRLDVQVIDTAASDDPPKMQSNSIGLNSLRLTLTNFGRQPVLATTTRVPITFLGTKQLYFTFALQSIGTVRVLSYTLTR